MLAAESFDYYMSVTSHVAQLDETQTMIVAAALLNLCCKIEVFIIYIFIQVDLSLGNPAI